MGLDEAIRNLKILTLIFAIIAAISWTGELLGWWHDIGEWSIIIATSATVLLGVLTYLASTGREQIGFAVVGIVGTRDEVRAMRGELHEMRSELNGKLDTANGKLDAANGKLDAANESLDAINGKLDAANGKLDAANGKLDAANGSLDAINGKLDAGNVRLDSVVDLLRDIRDRLPARP